MGCFRDHETKLAVVDQEAVAGLQRFENFRMRKMRALFAAGGGIGIEYERGAILELRAAVTKCTEPKLRSLQVGENADWASVALFDRADDFDELPHGVMRRVAHVDAEHVGARVEHAFNGGLVGRSRAEGRHDFGSALASHFVRDAGF
jgi:hypothetical protein